MQINDLFGRAAAFETARLPDGTAAVLPAEHAAALYVNEQPAFRVVCTPELLPQLALGRLLTEEFRLTEQDLLALFERHGYDLVMLEGFKSSGWPKIEVVRREIADAPVSFQPLAVVGDIPGADFGLEDIQPLADWIIAQMPTL